MTLTTYFISDTETDDDYLIVSVIPIVQKWIETQPKDLWQLHIEQPKSIFLTKIKIHQNLFLLMRIKFT